MAPLRSRRGNRIDFGVMVYLTGHCHQVFPYSTYNPLLSRWDGLRLNAFFVGMDINQSRNLEEIRKLYHSKSAFFLGVAFVIPRGASVRDSELIRGLSRASSPPAAEDFSHDVRHCFSMRFLQAGSWYQAALTIAVALYSTGMLRGTALFQRWFYLPFFQQTSILFFLSKCIDGSKWEVG